LTEHLLADWKKGFASDTVLPACYSCEMRILLTGMMPLFLQNVLLEEQHFFAFFLVEYQFFKVT